MSSDPTQANGNPEPMPGPSLCSEDEVTLLVHRFYARVREDELLSPVFARHVDDWPAHLSQLVDFWSAMLRGTRRFSGAPVQRHNALPGLDAAMFARWLALFRQTTGELENTGMAHVAMGMAERVAATLQARYGAMHVQERPLRPTLRLRSD